MTTDETNPKDLIGDTKCPLRFVPPALSISVAPAMANGAHKYGPFNWRQKKIRLSVYLEAIERHLLALKDGEDYASDSGCRHEAHIGANIAIIEDARAAGCLIDDRPGKVNGPAPAMMAAQVKGKTDAPKDPYAGTGSGGQSGSGDWGAIADLQQRASRLPNAPSVSEGQGQQAHLHHPSAG